MKQCRVVGNDLVHSVGWSEHPWRLSYGRIEHFTKTSSKSALTVSPLSHILAFISKF